LGTERLTVTGINLQGADQGAFVLPASLVSLQGMQTPTTLADRVTFIPQHVGYHELTVAIENDAMPNYGKDTVYVTFHGVGYLPDTTGFETSIIVDAVLDVCVDTSAVIRIENTGNTDNVIYDIEMYNGSTRIYSDTTTPFVLYGHTSRDVVVRFVPDRNWDGTLRSIVRHGNNQTDSRDATFALRIPEVEVTSTPAISVTPGASIDIVTHVSNASKQDLTVDLSGTYSLPVDRLMLNVDQAYIATVNDVIGTERQLPVTIKHGAAGEYRWVLGGFVQSPFHATWTVSANSLWKDTRAFDVRTTADATLCTDGSDATTVVTNQLCAGALRVVRFGAVPQATMIVTPNPVQDDFEIEVTASDAIEVSLHLLTVSGERFTVAEKILLIKGSQHVKFSRSHWANGLYWLVLQQGNAESGLPVMLVN